MKLLDMLAEVAEHPPVEPINMNALLHEKP